MASPATPTTALPPGSPIDGDMNTSTSVAIGLSNPQLSHSRQLVFEGHCYAWQYESFFFINLIPENVKFTPPNTYSNRNKIRYLKTDIATMSGFRKIRSR